MWKLLCGVLAALTMTFVLAPAGAGKPELPPARATPALWVVKDGDTTIYLFGTVHAMKPDTRWFEGPVKAAFDASDETVFEEVNPPEAELQALVGRMAMRTVGRTLTDALPADRREPFAKALAALGLPATALDRFQPWFASLMLSGLMLPKAGYDPAHGADYVLMDAALEAGKKRIGLETPEQQLAMLKAAPEDVQLAYLANLVGTLDRIVPSFERIETLWAAGRPDALGAAINEEMAKTPALAKRIIFDRDADWAVWIAGRMKRPGTVFVAVGAGHLGGPGNVRALLADRGIRVTRVQ